MNIRIRIVAVGGKSVARGICTRCYVKGCPGNCYPFCPLLIDYPF